MNKKILVIGSSGMLGHIVVMYLRERGYIVNDISFHNKMDKDTILLNVTDENTIQVFLKNKKFDYIINCAALLVNDSNLNKVEAIKINALFPHWLERFYSNTDTKIIQVSTAGVFYGDKAPYYEDDRSDAISFYGKTKSLGELCNEKDLTIRSDYFGPDIKSSGKSLFNWALQQKEKVNGYSRVYINGVTSLEFAKFIDYVIQNPIHGNINLYSKDVISKAELITKIYTYMNRNVTIICDSKIERNTSICNKRNDCKYINKTYDQQLLELVDWINSHKELYKHYYIR